jgi:hypothetical protein
VVLINYSSPYNTPILAICKGPNKWRLVQDLWLINEAIIPLHPFVPNPYTLLAQIPLKAQYYSVLDLKDTFFCTPLHSESQSLFAFEDPTNSSQNYLGQFCHKGLETALIFSDRPYPETY